MNTKEILLICAAGLLVGILFLMSAGMALLQETNPTQKTCAPTGGPVQEVKLSYANWVYVMEPNTLEAGRPVRMTVDLNSVTGCMRSVVISSFGVRKYVQPGDNIIEFTPTKTGTFNIACTMNMGATTFQVVDAQGNVGEFKEAAPTAGSGSCGGESGGCGCGGGAL